MEQLRKDATKLPLEVALLQAWLDAKANRFEEALAALAELGGQADAALTSGLARLQLLLERRDVERAAALLKQLLVDHFSLGLLGALVSLLAAGGQRAPAVALVDDALQRRDVGRLPLDTQVKLLRQAAAFHFKGGDAPKAAHCLQRMIQLQPSTVTLVNPSNEKQIASQPIHSTTNNSISFLKMKKHCFGTKLPSWHFFRFDGLPFLERVEVVWLFRAAISCCQLLLPVWPGVIYFDDTNHGFRATRQRWRDWCCCSRSSSRQRR